MSVATRGADKTHKSNNVSNVTNVTKELKNVYYNTVLPIEKEYLYHKFYSSEILESEMDSKPTILLVGQYSTG